ncbi:hypothetical protein ACFJGW_00975 [Burkholderiaceae bacterium UC74_6]
MTTTARQALTVALAVTLIAALVAAKVLWAMTLWYEWIALAVCGVSFLGLKLLLDKKSKEGVSSPSVGNDD